MKKDLVYTLKVYNKATNKQVEFIIKDDKTLMMLHPETKEEVAEISITKVSHLRLSN